jgi:hypothetical protein
MLNNIIEEEDDCFVFFYEEVDPEAHAILSELEGISLFQSISIPYISHACAPNADTADGVCVTVSVSAVSAMSAMSESQQYSNDSSISTQ